MIHSVLNKGDIWHSYAGSINVFILNKITLSIEYERFMKIINPLQHKPVC